MHDETSPGTPHLVGAPGPTADRPLRVLHVVESFGGGTLSALRQYMSSTPHVEHHVIRRVRDGEYVPAPEDRSFTTVIDMPAGLLRARAALRRSVRELQPDVIHAHSSLGGLVARVSVISRASRRVVYTPHCFAFERLDFSRSRRAIFRLCEWLLAANTHTVAGCSPLETSTADAWITCRRAVYVPNLAPDRYMARAALPNTDAAPTIIAAGRLSPQKDPGFYRSVVQELRSAREPVTAVWLGDGLPEEAEALRADGIEVSGWCSSDDVQSRLSAAAVYVHTAQWEGFPMMILEANALGLPIVARSIRSLSHLDPTVIGADAQDVAYKVSALLQDPHAVNLNVDAWRRILSDNTRTVQRARLEQAYSLPLAQLNTGVTAGQASRA